MVKKVGAFAAWRLVKAAQEFVLLFVGGGLLHLFLFGKVLIL
jgi:hypothetical protein